MLLAIFGGGIYTLTPGRAIMRFSAPISSLIPLRCAVSAIYAGVCDSGTGLPRRAVGRFSAFAMTPSVSFRLRFTALLAIRFLAESVSNDYAVSTPPMAKVGAGDAHLRFTAAPIYVMRFYFRIAARDDFIFSLRSYWRQAIF